MIIFVPKDVFCGTDTMSICFVMTSCTVLIMFKLNDVVYGTDNVNS